MLKVLVVSLSLRRANHSSERCVVLPGESCAAKTSGVELLLVEREDGATTSEVHEETVRKN